MLLWARGSGAPRPFHGALRRTTTTRRLAPQSLPEHTEPMDPIRTAPPQPPRSAPRREWVAPEVKDLPRLTELTLQSGPIGCGSSTVCG